MPDGNGEFAELGLEGVVDDMTAQDVPHGDAEFSRRRDGGFVAAPPGGHAQAPLLQRDRPESFRGWAIG
jgi:hypothetical protein